MPEPHRLGDRRHGEDADRPAGIANGEVAGIRRELDRLDARPKGVVFVFGGRVGRSRPDLEEVAVRRVEDNLVALGGRIPHDQPPAVGAPGEALSVDGLGCPGPLQLPRGEAMDAHHVLTGRPRQQGEVTCPGPEGKATGRQGAREDLGAANLGRLGRCEVEDGKLEAEGGDDADLCIRGAEADVDGLGAGDDRVPDGGLEAVVEGRHDADLLGIGDEQQARRGRPLEAEHGAGEVVAQPDHVGHAEPRDGADIDDGREERRDVFAVRTRERVGRGCWRSAVAFEERCVQPTDLTFEWFGEAHPRRRIRQLLGLGNELEPAAVDGRVSGGIGLMEGAYKGWTGRTVPGAGWAGFPRAFSLDNHRGNDTNLEPGREKVWTGRAASTGRRLRAGPVE